jgi:hypothetical protein
MRLEIELQNPKAKQDLKDTEKMIENYKKPMFILGQRMVQRHSEVDQQNAAPVIISWSFGLLTALYRLSRFGLNRGALQLLSCSF